MWRRPAMLLFQVLRTQGGFFDGRSSRAAGWRRELCQIGSVRFAASGLRFQWEGPLGPPGPPDINSRGGWGGSEGPSQGKRMMAHMQESGVEGMLDRDQTHYIRFVSYNVLCSKLSSPSFYVFNDPEKLDPSNRYEKLIPKLEREIAFRSIICLQEVSLQWYGRLYTFFARNHYHFIFTGYGHHFNGYMGVAIAIPIKEYDILDTDVTRVADVKPWPRRPLKESTGLISDMMTTLRNSVLARIWKAITTDPSKRRQPLLENSYETAKRRFNNIIAMRIKSRKNGQVFTVANYHMPCVYYLPEAMTMHVALALEYLERFSGSDPLVFCGDFNVLPETSCYKLITEGTIDEKDPEYPKMPDYDLWRPHVSRNLHSAYKLFTGTEPTFTNYAHPKDKDVFINTLDYIFITPGLEVVDVEHLPQKDDLDGPMPSGDQPSDHVLIAATIRMAKPSTEPEAEVTSETLEEKQE